MSVLSSISEFFLDESGLTVVEYVVGAGAMVAGFSGLFIAFRGIFEEEFSSLFSD